MRMWLNLAPPVCDVRAVGLDSSKPAIDFAMDAGVLDGGIARDFEQSGVVPTEEESAWFRSCNLLISTGAIGYVTERTLEVVLRHLGNLGRLRFRERGVRGDHAYRSVRAGLDLWLFTASAGGA